MKITVLSPHRDDAAFSVGLAIEVWMGAGHVIEVVNCFTQSRYSPLEDVGHVEEDDLQSYVTASRHREDVAWSRMYGSTVMLEDLELVDAPQRLHCSVDDVCGFPPRRDDAALESITSELQRTVKDALVLPLGMGDHVDHITARLAAEAGWPETFPIAFYEDLPYSARPGIADEIEGRVASLSARLQPGFVCEPGGEAAAIRRKRDFALCYPSQIDAEVVDQIAQFGVRYGGRERLWMNDAFRRSGLAL